ncbi:acyl-CoA synthetase [Streptomyces avermitilis]|uniref:Acyl-CoA synthetase, long-chain fatty acid:CoA ligase n=2 Tax=Streptomyces avermitilis TaxID=33903 RepID=Q82NP3_STRAW|nr:MULTISPECIES: acyl-CoA synthetase [Streptomyces]KUN55302.1 acyl-CoA synthetase [Streptomyces avermitilis]MYS96890.1 AMP-binding protein [Streptomyces sp. SID5469]OOV26597.1 acyl-CoA synthetase [Streptomyces avermitilis]BAC68968.1 putative acyl-CoA synthetase, long-chain fatty acid:CoA ligase [Streptomyces avermitilis MA-4680 = NBRC 14893]BBJ48903.1 acyl-CoA synthetase [Streptomyces avermitilis]
MTAGPSVTVDGVLRRSARRTPARRAIHYRDRSWTYAELDEAVSRAARALRETGLAPGDRVGAYGHNSDAYLIGFLACARAGLVHVPVNQNLTGDDLAYIVDQSGATLVLTDPDLAGNLADGVRTLALRDADDSLLTRLATTAQYDGAEPRGEDLAQLLYTSGTTALPKGAMMTHRALVQEYLSAIAALDLSAGDRPVHSLPLYHSAQMHVFLLPYLAVGAENVILDAPDAEQIFDLVEAGRADSLFAPPTVWIGLSNRPDFATRDLSGLRKAYYGASIMPVPVLERLKERLPELAFYNCFGQSEIGPLSMVLGPDEHKRRMDSCGRPVLFVEARVVDESGKEVADGEQGEIVYRSSQLCEGYWDKPEETAEAFRDGWFRSGDLAVRDAAGYFTVVDRVKDVINSGGVLVASRQVEDALYTHEGVAEAAVIGLPDERWIEAVTAVVVARGEVTEAELLAHAREKLAHFKAPKRVLFVDELPRNASGKILKRELRDRFAEA